MNNKHPYACHRVDTENYFLKHFYDHKIDGAILRLGNCFGSIGTLKGEGKNLFVNQLCNEVKTYGTLTIKSNPYEFRDFVPIEYLLQIIKKLIETKSSLGLYNVVTGHTKTLLQVAKEISTVYFEEFNLNACLQFDKNHKRHEKKILFDNERCKSLLKYNTKLYRTTLKSLLNSLN
tara:strand:- start:69 stop:596 length:528 start_codon:yes stop_codon:yes gene_type:complete